MKYTMPLFTVMTYKVKTESGQVFQANSQYLKKKKGKAGNELKDSMKKQPITQNVSHFTRTTEVHFFKKSVALNKGAEEEVRDFSLD